MSYASVSDLEAKLSDKLLVEISAESGTTADSAVLALVLAEADLEIDKRIGSRFATPLTSPAVVLSWLKNTALDLAPWLLYGRRGFGTNDAIAAAARESYREAIEWLDKVAAGTIDLPGAAARTDLTTQAAGQWTSFTPVYTSTATRAF